MLCTFMGGALTLLDVPSGGNRAVKESKHLLGGWLRIFSLSMVIALDGWSSPASALDRASSIKW